jgi:integrase/recombinase XerC
VNRHVNRYVADRLARREIDESSARSYRYRLLSLADHAHVPVERLTRGHVERWLAASGRSASYKRGQLVAAVGFLDWCVDHKLCRHNVARKIKAPRVARPVPRAFQKDEAKAELAACQDNRERVVVLLGLQEGLRIGEIQRLEVGDIDLRGEAVQVRGKGGRGSVTRVVPLTEQTRAAVGRYLLEHPAPAGPLVRSYTSGEALSVQHLQRIVARVLYDAGVKQAPYDGRSSHANRHTCAVDVLDESNDLPAVQQLLGHASLGTTGIYLGARASRLKSAVEGRVY